MEKEQAVLDSLWCGRFHRTRREEYGAFRSDQRGSPAGRNAHIPNPVAQHHGNEAFFPRAEVLIGGKSQPDVDAGRNEPIVLRESQRVVAVAQRGWDWLERLSQRAAEDLVQGVAHALEQLSRK
ncbi:MAG: hypothetical protein U0163_11615 [Gemmatimonadaceae bacterium]